MTEEQKERKAKNKFEERIPGSLSVISLTENERETLLDYLANSAPNSYSDFVWSLLGDDNWLMFFDVLEGLTVKIPSRQALVKVIGYVKIYSYLKSREFSEEAYEKAAKLFGKRVAGLKRIIKKVEKVLEGKEVDEKDD